MDEPLITVIVPVYNVELYLDRCIKSICNQTYRSLEIILVDDGSPDRCGEMCDEYASLDSRIRVIHKENGGLSDARNAGLDVMTGSMVGFVDSDDWIEAEMYETLLAEKRRNESQISCCGTKRIQEDGSVTYLNPDLDEVSIYCGTESQRELIRNTRVTNSVCDKLYDSSIFTGLRFRKGMLFEDFQIQPKCIARAQRVSYCAKPLYCYYQSPSSILRGNLSIKQYDSIVASQECVEYYKEFYPDLVERALVRHIELLLSLFVASDSYPEWKDLRKQMRRDIYQTMQLVRTATVTTNKLKMKMHLFNSSEALYMFISRLYAFTRARLRD